MALVAVVVTATALAQNTTPQNGVFNGQFDRRWRVAGHRWTAMLMGLIAAAWLALAAPAFAKLNLEQPDPNVGATYIGPAGYSADGMGQQGSAMGNLRAEMPAGSTVERAYLLGTYNVGFDIGFIAEEERTIDFEGTNVELQYLDVTTGYPLATGRADVTSQVREKVGGGGGITTFVIGNDPYGLDGLALVVIYSNPSLPLRTIMVLDGAAAGQGETATIDLAAPINKSVPDFSAILSVGIGYSNQETYGHLCGTEQFSTIDINSQRLTSCAGGFDDGGIENGSLITVGGVGDSTDDPAEPLAQDTGTDDELYDLGPLLKTGDTQLVMHTTNPPPEDDNLFLAVFQLPGEAALSGSAVSPTPKSSTSKPPPPIVTPGACIVPKLIGKKLKGAKRALRKGGCKIGKVKRKKDADSKSAKVVHQGKKGGKHLPAGTKVPVSLG